MNPAWEPYEDKKFAIGNAAHKILIGRGKDLAIFDSPDWNATGMGKGAKKELHEKRDEALAAGRVPILEHQHADADAMAQSMLEQVPTIPGCEGAFTEGHGEVVIIAEYKGIILRSMIDWMRSTTKLDDLKTTGMSASPDNLDYRMADGEWALQAAIQERILDVLDPDNAGRREHYFYLQEWDDPYEVSACLLPEATMTKGRMMLDKAIGIWTDCMAKNRWPGYPRKVHQPTYPAYMEARMMERMLADGDDE